MLKSILGAFIGKSFPYQGSLSTILAAILPHLYEAIQNNYGTTQKRFGLSAHTGSKTIIPHTDIKIRCVGRRYPHDCLHILHRSHSGHQHRPCGDRPSKRSYQANRRRFHCGRHRRSRFGGYYSYRSSSANHFDIPSFSQLRPAVVLSPKIFQIQGKQRTVAGEHRIFIGCHSCIRPLPPIPFLRSQKAFLHRSTGQWRNYF